MIVTWKSCAAIAATGRLPMIGIGVHDLGPAGPAVQADLFGAASPTESKVDKALDAVREKFGEDAVRRGRSFGTKLRRQGPPKVE